MFGLLRQEPNSALGSSLSVVDTDDKPLRRVRACTACRNRKLKCSLGRPQCNRCEAQKIPCHYPETNDSSKKSIPDPVSSTSSDYANLKRKRVKKLHTSTSQNKPKSSSSQRDHDAAAAKKERSKSVESLSSTPSHRLSFHPLPSPISPAATTEDGDGNDSADQLLAVSHNVMDDDGSWIDQLVMDTNHEGLQTYIDNPDMINMTSQWLGFDEGGADRSILPTKEGSAVSVPAKKQPSKGVQPSDCIISPIDETTPESMDLDHYFTDSPDMLLQSPVYSDLGFSSFPQDGDGMCPFSGGGGGGGGGMVDGPGGSQGGWTWEQQQPCQQFEGTNLFSAPAVVAQSSFDLPVVVSPSQASTTITTSSSVWSSRSSADRETNTSRTASSPRHVVLSTDPPTEMAATTTTDGKKKSIKTNSESSSTSSSLVSHKTTAQTNIKSTQHSSSRPKMTRSNSSLPYVQPSQSTKLNGPRTAEGHPLHAQTVVQDLEKLQISSFNFLQATAPALRNRKSRQHRDKARPSPRPPPYDALLKSQKQALSSCAVLLDCEECSSRSELVMLVVSVCSLLVGSLEGLDRSINGASGTGTDAVTYGDDGRMMHADSAEEGQYPGCEGGGDGYLDITTSTTSMGIKLAAAVEGHDPDGQKGRESWDGPMPMATCTSMVGSMMYEHDEEDTAQIIKTLTASRIAKLGGILERVVQTARMAEQRTTAAAVEQQQWTAHVGLASLLQGKLRRWQYSHM